MHKELYQSNCPQEVPIFHKPFFLDVVTNKSWDVCVLTEEDEIIASLPFYSRKHRGTIFIDQPPYTQFLGPWIKPEIFSELNQRRYHDIIEKLYDQLPPFGCYHQHWYYTYQNWLPLYWKGFKQSTRYTYIIPVNENIDAAWARINPSTKRQIVKCKRLYSIQNLEDFDVFFEMIKKNFNNKSNPYKYGIIKKLDESCKIYNSRIILGAYNETGILHGVIYLLLDKKSMYYFAGGCDKEGHEDNAMKLLMWEAVQIANKMNLVFDFEGSMMKNIEYFFSLFGGIQKGYFEITKVNSRKLIIKTFINNLLNR